MNKLARFSPLPPLNYVRMVAVMEETMEETSSVGGRHPSSEINCHVETQSLDPIPCA